MMEGLSGYYILISLILFLGLPFLTIKFPKFFWLYLFLFIPLYLFFVDQYVRAVRPSIIPDSIKIIKDLVWIYLLIGFIFWLMLKRVKIYFPREIGIPLLIFVFYLVLQLFRGYFKLGLFGTALAIRNTFGYLPAVFIVLLLIKKNGDLFKIGKYFSLAMLGAGIYALVQFVFHLETSCYILSPRRELIGPISSFFPDYNALAWFSAISFPLIVVLSKFLGNKKKLKILIYPILGLSIFCIIVSQSRTGLIAFLVALLLLFLTGIIRFKRAVTITILVLIIFSFLLVLAPEIITEHRIKGGFLSDIRFIEGWPKLWEYFVQKPIFGYGFGVFGFAALKLLQTQEYTPIGVDNFYYTILLNTGIIGLILFLLLIVAIFIFSIKLILRTKDKFIKNFLIGINITLVIYLIFAITTNFIESFPESVFFWFLIGTICAIKRLESQEKNFHHA